MPRLMLLSVTHVSGLTVTYVPGLGVTYVPGLYKALTPRGMNPLPPGVSDYASFTFTVGVELFGANVHKLRILRPIVGSVPNSTS